MCHDADGRSGRWMDASKHIGLLQNPVVLTGLTARTDHLDIVASVHDEPMLNRNGSQKAAVKAGPRARELYVSPANAATDAGTSVPPHGHFKVNHHGSRSFHHDVSGDYMHKAQGGITGTCEVPQERMIYRAAPRESTPAEPTEPGQVVVRSSSH